MTIDPNASATNADGTTREFTQQGFSASERPCCATADTCDCIATTAVPCGVVGTDTTNLPKMDKCFKETEFAQGSVFDPNGAAGASKCAGGRCVTDGTKDYRPRGAGGLEGVKDYSQF